MFGITFQLKSIFFMAALLCLSAASLHAEESLPPFLRLPAPLNTEGREYSPTVSADGNILIFNRRAAGTRFTDLFMCKRDPETGNWGAPRAMQNLNSPFHEEAPYLTPAGNVLFFASDRDGSKEMAANSQGKIRVSFDLYWSIRKADGWTIPRRLPGEVNTEHHERSPSYDPTTKTLFYSSWPFGDIKKSKIMAATFNNGRFQKPRTLPARINSGHQEVGLVPASNGKGYYFASQRPGGLGGWDIYFVGFKDGKFGKPINMGPKINTAAHEIYLNVRNDEIMLSSNRDGDPLNYDIFSTRLPARKPAHFEVVDKKTNEPLQLVVQTRIGKNQMRLESNAQGQFSIQSNAARARVQIKIPGYLPYDHTHELSQKETTRIELIPLEENASFTLHSINFDYNQATIKAESSQELSDLAIYLKQNASLKLEIIGHTDRHGADAYNQELSEQRARAVQKALEVRGVQSGRLQTRGAGFSKPISLKENQKADRLNRRTEFRVIAR